MANIFKEAEVKAKGCKIVSKATLAANNTDLPSYVYNILFSYIAMAEGHENTFVSRAIKYIQGHPDPARLTREVKFIETVNFFRSTIKPGAMTYNLIDKGYDAVMPDFELLNKPNLTSEDIDAFQASMEYASEKNAQYCQHLSSRNYNL